MESLGKQKAVDVAVIGGGITGAAIARDAALRGISVLLLEKGRFGSGTSSKSSRLIHGGIRYLELAWNALKKPDFRSFFENLRFVAAGLREARTLEQIAPDLVKPIEILIPVYTSGPKSPLAVYAGVIAYWFLAALTGKAAFPRILGSPRRVLGILPQLRKEGLKGGVVIHDRITDDAELVRRTVASAVRHGAEAIENAAVLSYRRLPDTALYELAARAGDKTEFFSAKRVINATGPWADRTRSLGGERNGDLVIPVAGSHIMVKKFTPISALLRAADGRVFFMINTGEYSRVGTTERIFDDPDRVQATPEETAYLVDSLRRCFPREGISQESVITTDAGIRPLARRGRNPADPNAISREHLIETAPSGVIHVIGVKLTDHRRVAEQVVDLITPGLRRDNPRILRKSVTATILL